MFRRTKSQDIKPELVRDPDEVPADEVRLIEPEEEPVRQSIGPVSKASRLPWHLPESIASAPGIAADQATIGDLVLRAASVVGPAHRCVPKAKPRQDAYRVSQDASGAHLIIAVADGMSDSSRSDFGASVAVSRAVGIIRRQLDAGTSLDDLSAPEIFGEVATAMFSQARSQGLSHDEIRTTLAVAVLPTRVADDGWLVGWGAKLADTHAWLRTSDGWACFTGGPKASFNGSGLDEYLPHLPQAVYQFRVELSPGMAFGLMTDGIGDAFDQVSGVTEWLNERWAAPPSLVAFIMDTDFEAKGQQDDRTAAVVWVRPSGSGSAEQ